MCAEYKVDFHDPQVKVGRHLEIAYRYSRHEREKNKNKRIARRGMAAIRVRELTKVVLGPYGGFVHYGMWRFVFVVCVHLCSLGETRDKKVKDVLNWIELYVHWMNKMDAMRMVKAVEKKSEWRWRADTLAKIINLREWERTALGIRTIGSVDMTSEERKRKTKERWREKKMIQRRLRGSVSRSEYENNSLAKLKPWEEEGISRSTWFARKKAGQVQKHISGRRPPICVAGLVQP